MNRIFSGLLFAFMALTVMSCEKEETIVDPPKTENPTFTSTNVKEGAVYYSFDTKQEVPMWDLVFKSNGQSPDFYLNTVEVGGKQQVGIYNTGVTDFDAVTSFDPVKITSDADTSVSGGNWYDYNMNTHQITSKGLVYIVYGASDNVYKFRIESYSASVYTLKYARYNATTTPPAFEAAQTATVSKAAGPAMFSFAKGLVAAETAGKDWDVKLTVVPTVIPPQGTILFPGIMLNTDKNVAVKVVDNKAFDAVDAATETGLVTDTAVLPVIGINWFDYNMNTHRVTSKNHTYVVATAAGKRTKFRVTNYYNSSNVAGFMTLEHTEAK